MSKEKELMNVTFLGHALVGELLADPRRFTERGRAYDLLQHYFHGYPATTLRPLLASEDLLVRRAAAWIASELGSQACSLTQQIIPLVYSCDRHLKYYALQVLIVCSAQGDGKEFVHVAGCLESDDETIRVLAMRLVANANETQLEAAASSSALGEKHRAGLAALSKNDSLNKERVQLLLADDEALTRRYGAVAARRLLKQAPQLIAIAAASQDEDISRFAKQALEDANSL
jgi:hypothetical protein